MKLWDRVEKEWDRIPSDVYQNFIESMPRWIEAVINAKGGHTTMNICINMSAKKTVSMHSIK